MAGAATSFSASFVVKLISDLLQVKIKYHETKIESDDDEETMKMRENRIIKLQNELTAFKKHISMNQNSIVIESEITIS